MGGQNCRAEGNCIVCSSPFTGGESEAQRWEGASTTLLVTPLAMQVMSEQRSRMWLGSGMCFAEKGPVMRSDYLGFHFGL